MLLDALGYVGEALMKPGRMVRGALLGRPDELLAGIPFSDSLGLTDHDRAVSGSTLLDELGYAAPEDSTERMLTGIGAEILTDPLTFIGGTLLNRGARALAGTAPAARTADAATEIGRLRPPPPPDPLEEIETLRARLIGDGSFNPAPDAELAILALPEEFWTRADDPAWLEVLDAQKRWDDWVARIPGRPPVPRDPAWNGPTIPDPYVHPPSPYPRRSLEGVYTHELDDNTLIQMLIRDQGDEALRTEAYNRAINQAEQAFTVGDEVALAEAERVAELLKQTSRPIYWDGRRWQDAVEVMESGGLDPSDLALLNSAIEQGGDLRAAFPEGLKGRPDFHEAIAPQDKARILADWWHFQDENQEAMSNLYSLLERHSPPDWFPEIPNDAWMQQNAAVWFGNRLSPSRQVDLELAKHFRNMDELAFQFGDPLTLRLPDNWLPGSDIPTIFSIRR